MRVHGRLVAAVNEILVVVLVGSAAGPRTLVAAARLLLRSLAHLVLVHDFFGCHGGVGLDGLTGHREAERVQLCHLRVVLLVLDEGPRSQRHGR